MKLHQGYKIDYSIGFDCYGTAIENLALNTELGSLAQKPEYLFSERLDTKNLIEDKNFDQKALEIRSICRKFVKESMKSQIQSYIRWGIMHDYRYSYMSSSKNYEASILESFAEMMSRNYIYRSGRPVFWSAKSQRVLAEEELEQTYKSTTAHLVKFKVKDFGKASKEISNMGNIHLLAFVDEPWKLVSTQALAVNPNVKYSLAKDSRKNYFIIAFERMGELATRLDRYDLVTDLTAPGEALFDLELEHPLFKNQNITVVPDNKVSSAIGTGINIVSPLSSIHDLELADIYNLNIESYLTKDGLFTGELHHELENCSPFKKGNEIVEKLLKKSKSSLLSYDYEIEYTRVKNTKERVMLNSIDSWFFRIPESLRQRCFEELAYTKFRPKLNMKNPEEVDRDYEELSKAEGGDGYAGVGSYYFNVVEELNEFDEWCISEKNYWGIPIPYFYNKLSRRILINEEIILHVAKIFREHGADAWFELSIRDLLPEAYKSQANHLVKGDEVFDVWFDNALTWKSVLVDKVNQDEFMKMQETDLDNALMHIDHNSQYQFRTKAEIEEESKKLNIPQRRGRRSMARLLQQRKQREAMVNRLNFERNEAISNTDIQTFKALMPEGDINNEERIKELINAKLHTKMTKNEENNIFPAN